MNGHHLRYIITVMLLTFLFVFMIIFISGILKDYPVSSNIKWHITFSKIFASQMGLDWKETYLAILDDLRPRSIRLPIYWEDIESQQGNFNFADYDWAIDEAQKRNTGLILVIGRKLPRWPECHEPDWAKKLEEKSKQEKIIALIKNIVSRYKGRPNINLWQVENEPFLPFGECQSMDSRFLDEEIAAVRSLDPNRKIMITDSGEISDWVRAASRADVFGTTMYRQVHNRFLGYIKYPLPPQFFRLKANFLHLFYPNKPILVSELQAEPWSAKQLKETSLEDQFKLMSFKDFSDNIEYAKRVGFPEVYLWGAEWWWWLKTKHNKPEFWEYAKELISQS